MYDMLGYLDHQFAPGESRLVVAATRHEDGTFASADVLEWHRQRGRLLRSLTDIEGAPAVEFSDDIDAEDPRETGYAVVDLLVASATIASSIAAVISTWLSLRPRQKKDSVPGVRLELPGKTLILSGRLKKKETQRLVEAFLASSAKPSRR
jgi:hypothetical protein